MGNAKAVRGLKECWVSQRNMAPSVESNCQSVTESGGHEMLRQLIVMGVEHLRQRASWR
jgi:hypothetical protein